MKILSTGQIAQELNVDRDVVSYLIRKHKISPVCRVGATRVYSREEFTEILNHLQENQNKRTRGGL